MHLRRLNRAVHRDLGYFLAGTTILYALSGLAVNHRDHWNPSFVVTHEEVRVPVPEQPGSVSRAWVLATLERLGDAECYRAHDSPTPGKLKIYLDDGSLFVNLRSGEARREAVRRRPLFYSINLLHLNPTKAWLVFSDIFAAGLIVVAVSGLFVLGGRRGIAGRGAILVTAGGLVPLAFMLLL